MSQPVADYFYELPQDLIACRPAPERDASRMMVVDRASGEITHRMFRDFPSFLREGDLVLLNDTRVIKARLLAPEKRIEIFLLEPLGDRRWKCLTKPGRKMRTGAAVAIAGTQARVLEMLPGGERIVEFLEGPDLEKHGHMPVPPYFKRESDAGDDERYQTVYASHPGSVAAPTAGLHFTPEVLAGIPHSFLTLHVGAGTFLPVKTDLIEDHVMHEESYEISDATAKAANDAARIVAVGTTVARVLESRKEEQLEACSGRTDVFIFPPYRFRRVGAMLTNFHLPCSTLLMLVSAFAGKDLIRRAYAEGIRERYRFFSYGDCMLVV
ncbi:MAG: tRNA preQ1(34) S-adenosylmethionine ribosyltransferase-isomerase QueA [Terrimicrobiaceae bacterium]